MSRRVHAEIGKQSPKTLLDAFERYIEGYMTLFDANKVSDSGLNTQKVSKSVIYPSTPYIAFKNV